MQATAVAIAVLFQMFNRATIGIVTSCSHSRSKEVITSNAGQCYYHNELFINLMTLKDYDIFTGTDKY